MLQYVALRLSTYNVHPWITSELRGPSIRKQKTHIQARRSKEPRDVKRFKTLKWQLQREVHTSTQGLPGGCCKWWHAYKPKTVLVIHQNQKVGLISDSNTQVKRRIPPHGHYQQSRHPEGTVSLGSVGEDLSAFLDFRPSPYSTMSNIHERGVLKLLKGLRPFKASGPDKIPAFILNHSAESLAPYLTRMYQLSLDQGQIQDE